MQGLTQLHNIRSPQKRVRQAQWLEKLTPFSAEWQEWEELVRANPQSGIMQSLHWAQFKAKQGLQCLLVTVRDCGTLVAGGLFYCNAQSNGAGIIVCPEGPVLPWHDEQESKLALQAVLECVRTDAAQMQAIAVRIEPRIDSSSPWLFRGFGRAPVDLVPRETLYISLDQTEEELLAAMRPKGRYNIRVALRHGVEIIEEPYSNQSVCKFYAMLQQAGQRDDFIAEPLSFFDHLLETLAPHGFARLLFAEHHGETLGALLLTTYGTRATYLYGGISNNKRNLMAGYALQWQAMLAAKRAGCAVYDLYGFDRFGTPGHPYARFSRFKRQFGGEAKLFAGAHDSFFTARLADVLVKALNECSQGILR